MSASRIMLPLCAALALAAVPARAWPDARAQNLRRLEALGLEWVLPVIAGEPSPRGTRVWIRRDATDRVIGIDEGGRPADRSAGPDSVEDVAVVDYGADGTIDRVLDWSDLDRDGRPERQILYALTPAPLGGDFMSCVVVDQRAAERGFWHLVRWQYQQEACQTRCDFSGDGFFALGRYDDRRRAWQSFDENPFAFYDPDGDGLTEEVLLLVGEDRLIRRARWSFDVDNDAVPTAPYDYDFSLTLAGPLRAPAAACDTLPLRGGGLPVVAWDRARDFVRAARWQRVLLAWDENDRNVAPEDLPTGERWEGVIAEGVAGFDAVGGPGCGLIDKRYELDSDASGRMSLYVSPVDLRLHLLGAQKGWLTIDADGDGRADGRIEMDDRDGDGYFDRWRWDRDGDGVFEAEVTAEDDAGEPVPPLWAELSRAEGEARARWTAREAGPAAPPATQAERFAADVGRWTARNGTEPFRP